MKFCPKRGLRLEDESVFCGRCGLKLPECAEPDEARSYPKNVPDGANDNIKRKKTVQPAEMIPKKINNRKKGAEETSDVFSQKKKKPKRKTRIIAAIGAIALLLIIASFCALHFLSGKKRLKKTQKPISLCCRKRPLL